MLGRIVMACADLEVQAVAVVPAAPAFKEIALGRALQ